MAMTSQQQRFVEEYMADPARNGRQAAIRAGYSSSTATSQASRLLKRDDVQALIQKLTEEQGERLEIQRDAVVLEYLTIAHADVRDFLEQDTHGCLHLRKLGEMGPSARAIKAIKQKKDGTVEVVLHDKHSALKVLAATVGLTTERRATDIGDEERAAQKALYTALTKVVESVTGSSSVEET